MKESRLPDALVAKNSIEFEKTTQSIKKALATIESNLKLKPTQSLLAKLAGCTRGTLNNRIWPNTELNRIKSERQISLLPDSKSPTVSDKQETEIEKLKAQINLCRTENARLHELNELIKKDLKQTQELLAEIIKQSNNPRDIAKSTSPAKVISLVKSPQSP